jgi:phosphate acetyltransferase
MSDFLQKVLKRAKQASKTIVLPEGDDERVLQAVNTLTEQKIAKVIILGDQEKLTDTLSRTGADMSQITITNPLASDKRDLYAQGLYEVRKYRGVTIEKAAELVKDPIYFGTMMVKAGDADGLVAGATHSTANTIRPALQIIRPVEGFKTVSSVFFMCFPDNTYVFADCGIIENPTAAQLSDIAVYSSAIAIQFGIEPRIAMLSYSTKGSARGEGASKIVRATERAKEKISALFGYGGPVIVDGELQFDAAFVPDIAERKCPDSPLKGNANVFIFPDLGAGNLCYKAVQRMAGANAYGPILTGLAKPVNDMSRGCSAEDIVAIVAITAVQAY